MDAEISKQLEDLVGKTIFFQGQNHKIEKWKLVGGNYCIVTNARTLQFYPSEIQLQFLDKIEDEQAAEVIRRYSHLQNYSSQHNTTSNNFAIVLPEENKVIKQTLLDVLKKVKDDPGYLAQAKAVCEVTNTMVNVHKAEIELMKLQNDMR